MRQSRPVKVSYREDFQKGVLPKGWVVLENDAHFHDGCLKLSGKSRLKILIPEPGFRKLTTEVTLELTEGRSCQIIHSLRGLCPIITSLFLNQSQEKAHTITRFGVPLAREDVSLNVGSGECRLSFEAEVPEHRVCVNGKEILKAHDASDKPLCGHIDLWFSEDTLIRDLTLTGDQVPAQPAPLRQPQDFSLEVCIDFYDDLYLNGPFTAQTFRDYFREIAACGAKRVFFLCHGGQKYGWWDFAPHGEAARSFRATCAAVGDILPAAVKAGHEQGLEVWGLFKPFDMGIQRSVGESTALARSGTKYQRIGGPAGWVADFIPRHPELLTSRRPGNYGECRNPYFTRIDLVKEDDCPAAFTVGDIELYVSDDNATYRLYDGPLIREETIEEYPVWEHTPGGGRPTGSVRKSRVMRLKNLHLAQKYFALLPKSDRASFANNLINLVHVFGPEGEEGLLTYGVRSRWVKGGPSVGDFRELGVEFDHGSPPTANLPGSKGRLAERWSLDRPCAPLATEVLAMARGKERGPFAVLSPSFPATRQWWLDIIAYMLDAGVDGVDLRVSNHHSELSWLEYGFEEPVVRAFQERYGVDLLATDDFNREHWRRLRGEAYTQFYREAGEAVHRRGKKLRLHVCDTLAMEPDQDTPMQMHWDWRTWLKENLADEVTLKDAPPQSYFGREVIALARQMRMPVYYCSHAPSCKSKGAGCLPTGKDVGAQRSLAIVNQMIREAREAGCDGFQFYESASLLSVSPEGLVAIDPGVKQNLRDNFTH